MLFLNYDNVIFSFIFDISWGHIQLTTHMITLWLHSWTCSGTSLWSNWEPGNMVMNPLIISAQHHLYSPTRGKFVFIIHPKKAKLGCWALFDVFRNLIHFGIHSVLTFISSSQTIKCMLSFTNSLQGWKISPYENNYCSYCLQSSNPILQVMRKLVNMMISFMIHCFSSEDNEIFFKDKSKFLYWFISWNHVEKNAYTIECL